MKNKLFYFFSFITTLGYTQSPSDIAQSFGTISNFNNNVLSIATQANGKILAGGDFIKYNGIAEKKIIRLNADGTKDTSFNTGTGFDNTVNTIAIQTDGKILVGGNFTKYQGVTENYIIRLNPDGTKDTTFSRGTGDGYIFTIIPQADGKILLGGDFNTYYGASKGKMVRLNADGTVDKTFNIGVGFNARVYAIVPQADGKILVGGSFTDYKGVTENRIIRLNPDGTKDTSFNTGTGFNSQVYTIALQADGKILVGGNYLTYQGITENYIIRLNPDGSKDTTFNTGTGFNQNVLKITPQADGTILMGGLFTTYNGVTENRIILLNADGTKNTAFETGAGFNSYVWDISKQANGTILIGGNFTSYKNNTSSAYLIGLHTVQSLSTDSFYKENNLLIYPNPVNDVLQIQLDNFKTVNAVKIYDLQGKLLQESNTATILVNNLAKGLYVVKVTSENGEISKKFIKE